MSFFWSRVFVGVPEADTQGAARVFLEIMRKVPRSLPQGASLSELGPDALGHHLVTHNSLQYVQEVTKNMLLLLTLYETAHATMFFFTEML